MPQLGILFDAQKLGSGFYGYTAFRILFTVLPPRELAGCGLFHGEIGDGRTRPYCIAIENDSLPLLARIRQTFATSMARGLLPAGSRFLDGGTLTEEVLALAARVDANGEMVDCHSRWLQEAWQRAQGQAALVSPEPPRATVKAKPVQESRVPPNLPDSVPIGLRCSASSAKALAFLVAFSAGGALAPWVGAGIAICAMMATAGALQAVAMLWRLWAEETISGRDVVMEAKKLLGAKPIHEVSEKLVSAASQASPLLRRLHVSTRAGDMAGACLIAEEHSRADQYALSAGIRELRTHAWGVLGIALCSIAAMTVFQGQQAAFAETPRLAAVGLSGCLVLHWMASVLCVRGERMESRIRRQLAAEWLPALAKALPAQRAQSESLERSLHELTQEFQSMRTALERRRDSEFVDTMSDLRSAVEQLTPVLAGFREPFVLQAVPAAARPKAMSATA